jgi:hypothetical protein
MKNIKSLFFIIVLLIAFSQVKGQGTTPGGAMNRILDAYYGVKNALADDNCSVAQNKANELFKAIIAVPADKFTPEQGKLWLSYIDKLQFDSRHISESSALDHQREHFTSLSKNLFEVIKGMKLNTAAVYEQYCPMKKATWMSETEAINNPYLGKEMPDCGKTTATLYPAGK